MTRAAEIKRIEKELDQFPLLRALDMPPAERREIKKIVKIELRDFAQTFTRQAVLKLADLMERSRDENVQIRAAELLLNYGWGKPTQAVDGRFDGKLTISWMGQAQPGDNATVIDIKPERERH